MGKGGCIICINHRKFADWASEYRNRRRLRVLNRMLVCMIASCAVGGRGGGDRVSRSAPLSAPSWTRFGRVFPQVRVYGRLNAHSADWQRYLSCVEYVLSTSRLPSDVIEIVHHHMKMCATQQPSGAY